MLQQEETRKEILGGDKSEKETVAHNSKGKNQDYLTCCVCGITGHTYDR